jgi:GNAT superfamily N-acetyltransferase
MCDAGYTLGFALATRPGCPVSGEIEQIDPFTHRTRSSASIAPRSVSIASRPLHASGATRSFPGTRRERTSISGRPSMATRSSASATANTGAYGQWWTDRVAAEMSAEARKVWLDPPHFEVVQLHVLPSAQRTGIGARLLDTLLEQPNDRALLSMDTQSATAGPFYRKHGWRTISSWADHAGEKLVLGKDNLKEIRVAAIRRRLTRRMRTSSYRDAKPLRVTSPRYALTHTVTFPPRSALANGNYGWPVHPAGVRGRVRRSPCLRSGRLTLRSCSRHVRPCVRQRVVMSPVQIRQREDADLTPRIFDFHRVDTAGPKRVLECVSGYRLDLEQERLRCGVRVKDHGKPAQHALVRTPSSTARHCAFLEADVPDGTLARSDVEHHEAKRGLA